MEEFSELEKKLGIEFTDKDLLKQAFIHRSYLNEHPEIALPHNERLEFLGDAVLELVVTRYLYSNYPNPEGELTNWRAALVNSKILGQIGEGLGFNDFMLLSKGEAKDAGKARHFILANAMEAFIGSLYLDKGYDAASEFITKYVLVELPSIIKEQLYQDPKSKFQEKAQEVVGITPTYNVIDEWGPDHERHFVVGVYLGEELIAKGEGSSKQEAQEEAAKNGLEVKGW
ncbi:MAG: ribonuclease III [Candidatus Spechtbacteria bacterium]|nr:ribonuclease III [Candidatus Spechtbacteria bacterium]